MSRKNMFWTIIFVLSCSLAVIFDILGIREQILHPFSAVFGLYFTLVLVLIGLAIFSGRRIEI